MSIRSAMVVLGVCVSFSAQAAPVFTPGDVFWISRKPMAMYEVSGGSSTTLTPYAGVFPSNWNSLGTLLFADDGSAGYLAVSEANLVVKLNSDGTYSNAFSYTSPTGLAFLGGAMYVASTNGTLSKVVNGSATQVLTGLDMPRTIIPYEGGLVIAEQGGGSKGRIRKVSFNNGTPVSTYFSGMRPIDMVVFGGYLYYTDVTTNTITETITKVVQMDLVTGAKTDHAWGQRFWGLTVANGRLLASNYKESSSSIWDITAPGDYTTTAAWASGLPGASDLMLATVPGTRPAPPPPPPPPPGPDPDPDPGPQTPPAETPEASTLLLMATGLLMMSVRGIRRSA